MDMKNIYRRIAEKYGVSLWEVERDMQNAIAHAYLKEDKPDAEKAVPESFSGRGKVPTADEFIRALSHKIREG